jgi:serine protease inhibitor
VCIERLLEHGNNFKKNLFIFSFQLLLRNELEAVDFKNEEKARTTINNWVEQKTLKKIQNLVTISLKHPESGIEPSD